MIFVQAIFLISAFIYFIFLILVQIGIKNSKRKSKKNDDKPFISVIIPFRNEAENILSSLKSIEEQDYPGNRFEIIYIDDNSDDNSFEKLAESINKENIKILKLPPGFAVSANKKRAIKYGINQSKGEIIVTTDADCTHSNFWLSQMINEFDDDTDFISGAVTFKDDSTLFKAMQQLEFAGLVLTGFGLIGLGFPTICNGANIAYRRKAFEKVQGFDDNLSLSSGDDELLMQKISKYRKGSVKFTFQPETMVQTNSNKNLKDFLEQRKRWASKTLFYKNYFLVFLLVVIFTFFLSIPLNFLLGVIVSSNFIISGLILLLGKIIFEYFVLQEGIPVFYPRIKMKTFLFAEIFHIPYILFAAIKGILGGFSWKGRNLRR